MIVARSEVASPRRAVAPGPSGGGRGLRARGAAALARLLGAAGLVLSAGCLALSPRLPPVAPPPNVPPGQVLLVVPAARHDTHASSLLLASRDAALPALETRDPVLAEHVRSRRVVTGMTAEQAIWSFGVHPDRVRDHGPPGTHVLLWESGRYWVRTDPWGRVVAAGHH